MYNLCMLLLDCYWIVVVVEFEMAVSLGEAMLGFILHVLWMN